MSLKEKVIAELENLSYLEDVSEVDYDSVEEIVISSLIEEEFPNLFGDSDLDEEIVIAAECWVGESFEKNEKLFEEKNFDYLADKLIDTGRQFLSRIKPSKWLTGKPTKTGCYVLEFSEGDRFVIARAITEDGILKLEDANCGGYISDSVLRHMPITDFTPKD